MSANNSIRLIGRLGKNPEMRYSAEGKAVTKASIAVDNRRNEKPDWFDMVVFGTSAENFNQYAAKGRLIAVEGEIHQSTFEGSDGATRTKWEVTVSDWKLLDKPPAAAAAEEGASEDIPE